MLLTIAEHHSAVVPWHLLAQKTGVSLKYVGLSEEGIPDVAELRRLLSNKTKLVSVHHVSNALGW